MRTALGLGAGVCLPIALTLFLFARPEMSAAITAGEKTYYYRARFAAEAKAPPPHPRRIAWFGDSTILGADSYALQLGRELPNADSYFAATPGFDAFGFFCVIDSEIERARPRVVVLLANLLTLHRGYGVPVSDLASELPVRSLPGATLLPLHEFGITVPKLLLLRSVRTGLGERAMYFADGLPRLVQDSDWWAWAGPPTLPPLQGNLPELIAEIDGVWASPLGSRMAKVRLLAATVRAAVERGVPVLVEVPPLPVDQVADAGLYDRARFQARIDMLRAVVVAEGGSFVDLHDAVGRDGFGDLAGHLNAAGHRRVVDLLRAPLGALLDRAG